MNFQFYNYNTRKWMSLYDFIIWDGSVHEVCHDCPDISDDMIGDELEGFLYLNSVFLETSVRRNDELVYPNGIPL